MIHFRVVTSVSFGGGGNFLKKHNEDPTPKFVIFLYNEKVLSTPVITRHSLLYFIPYQYQYIYIIQTDHCSKAKCYIIYDGNNVNPPTKRLVGKDFN